MSTTLERPKPRTGIREIDVHAFEHHWQDEADAAYLYRLLSAAEPDPKKKDVYARLADVEDRHVVVWADLLSQHGHPPRKFRPSGRARLLAALGRWFGPSFLLPMLLEMNVPAIVARDKTGGEGRYALAVRGEPGAVWRAITGGNTLARVGVVVLFIGVAFLVKYASEHVTIPIGVRLAGIALD